MKAVIFREHSNSLDVLEVVDDMPEPEAGPGEVVVNVRYAALNRLDDFVRRGWPGLKLELPHILGSDCSGVIAAVGEGVTGWDIGQSVAINPGVSLYADEYTRRGEHTMSSGFVILGEHIPGAYAEYVKAPAENLIPVPPHFDMAAAAAAPLAAVTAWRMLCTRARLRAAETVLIVGSGGGVNTMAMQIAKLCGATVYVVAGDDVKERQALSLGADWVVNRRLEENWSKAVWQQTERKGVDVVVDNVGSATWTDSLRVLRPGGRLVTVGGSSGYQGATPINLIFGRQLQIIGSTMGTPEEFRTVMELIFAGKLKAVVDQVFPLNLYKQALQYLLRGQQFGKVVLRVA